MEIIEFVNNDFMAKNALMICDNHESCEGCIWNLWNLSYKLTYPEIIDLIFFVPLINSFTVYFLHTISLLYMNASLEEVYRTTRLCSCPFLYSYPDEHLFFTFVSHFRYAVIFSLPLIMLENSFFSTRVIEHGQTDYF